MSYFLKKTFIEKLNLSRRIVPLIDHEDLNDVLKYIDFMTKHNFHIFEYTLRRKAQLNILKNKKSFSNIVLGAGSVLERKTITSLTKLEIDFFVSPGVITTRQPKSRTIYRCPNSTEILECKNFSVLKLFPSNSLEIINYLKTINGPFPNLKFIPTGGINIKNYFSIISLPNVLGVAGSFIYPKNKK